MPAKTKDQLALDERQIEDSTLEGLLEARLTAAQDKAEVGGVFKKADDAAKAAISLLPIEDDSAVRVGRFRITKSAIAARSVSFDTEASTRIRISLADEDGAKPATANARGKLASVPDPDADVRPTGEVNAAALRGEADRSVVEGEGPVH